MCIYACLSIQSPCHAHAIGNNMQAIAISFTILSSCPPGDLCDPGRGVRETRASGGRPSCDPSGQDLPQTQTLPQPSDWQERATTEEGVPGISELPANSTNGNTKPFLLGRERLCYEYQLQSLLQLTTDNHVTECTIQLGHTILNIDFSKIY